MGVVSRRWVRVESMSMVVRRYIDFLIFLIPTPLASALFAASLLFVVFLKCFSFFMYIYIYINKPYTNVWHPTPLESPQLIMQRNNNYK